MGVWGEEGGGGGGGEQARRPENTLDNGFYFFLSSTDWGEGGTFEGVQHFPGGPFF